MKLNKKGYMLVEIILASALAFGLAFFIIDLVIRLKNKNDDLLVETLITTDKTIITNKLMSYAKSETKNFDCNKLTITGNTVKYKDEIINIITDYANVGELSCSTKAGKVSITIPISVPQMPNKDYDITFDYKYEIGDITPPTCSITVSGTTITATFQDNDGGSGIAGDATKKATINGAKDYIFTGEDNAGNSKSCGIRITSKTPYCSSSGYYISGDYCVKTTNATAQYNIGWCKCESNDHSETYEEDCPSTDACPCKSGYYVKEDGNCYKKFAGYRCSRGRLNGNKCIISKNISYKCDSGTNNISNNDNYCYTQINS